MARYVVTYSGSVGVRPLSFVTEQMSDERAQLYVRRDLPNYWPVYYSAQVWEAAGEDGAEGQFLGECTSRVEAR